MYILVIEDDPLIRGTIVDVLRKNGHEVEQQENGAAALEMMQRPAPPSLVVLDWMLPGLDGIELIRIVRSWSEEVQPYILLLTARNEKADIVTGLNAGADDYLVKPFDHQELIARVQVGVRLVKARHALNRKIEELNAAFDQIKMLRGILPICMHCKKIRDDRGYWNLVEDYILEHSEAELSHAMCPDCLKKLYPDFAE